MTSPIKPLGDRVVAEPEIAQSKTASGLYIPEKSKEKSVIAKIIAVGPKSTLKINDRILYKEYSTTEFRINDNTYLIISEEDILATLQEK